MDVDAIKERNRWMWGLGDYSALSEALRPAAEALADACAVSAGQEVLDVAAGDGNFAVACAREGASVVASDLSPGMVERGRARSEQDGFDIEWVEADVEDLPFEDGRFDCVGSVFGAMIAPRPRVVAEELFRVVRPGGTVGMTAWTPRGFSAELFKLGRSYAATIGRPAMSTNGPTRTTVRERFDGLAARFEIERADAPVAVRLARGDGLGARDLGAAVGCGEAEPAARSLGAAHLRGDASWASAGPATPGRSSSRTSTR